MLQADRHLFSFQASGSRDSVVPDLLWSWISKRYVADFFQKNVASVRTCSTSSFIFQTHAGG